MAGMKDSKEMGGLGEIAPGPSVSSSVAERRKNPVATVPDRQVSGVGVDGVTRAAEEGPKRYGRGPIPYDSRKFDYDRLEGRRGTAMKFGATRSDRMDADEARQLLHRIHEMVGIAREAESVIMAFDKALFFEHAVNGASLLQPGRGLLKIGAVGQESAFELAGIKQLLGAEQRRFFRAYADEVSDVLREVLAAYDSWDPVSVEMHAQVMQIAVDKNLIKYPYLIHDSAEAGNVLSVEERTALIASKKVVLETTRNKVDVINVGVDDKQVV